jgi:acetyltransferase-like isoleucine patch superfamily enzyme
MSILDIAFKLYWRLRWGAVIGSGSKIAGAEVMRMDGGSINVGRNCRLHRHALIAPYGGSIRLGDRVSVNPFSILYGHGGLAIGNDVRIAAHVVIVPMNHGVDDRDVPIRRQSVTARGIRIGNDVWIGAGARILDGVDIADGCVIAAGAVLTKPTEPFGIYAGVPARLVRRRGEKRGDERGAL